MAFADDLETLRRQIDASGGPDSYIDEMEEEDIFRDGEQLGISEEWIEAELNARCRNHGWTRANDIAQDMRDQLDQASAAGGGVSRRQFQLTVEYGVAQFMPRKEAVALAVNHVVQNDLHIRRSWFGGDWFDRLRAQHGL